MHADTFDDLRDLLSVGTDVLDRRGADQPRDTRKALGTADPLLTYLGDECIPICSGRDIEEDFISGSIGAENRVRHLQVND